MRDSYWDILKGLGIIAFVMGYADVLALNFSLFFVAIFFFVSGFWFKAEKCLDYGDFFLNKLRTLWKPFVLYNVAFFVLHDFFIYIGWIALQPVPEEYGTMVASWIDVYELPRYISAVIFKGEVEIMCGATWLIPPFFSNALIFAILVKVTYNKPAWQLPVLVGLFFVLGVEVLEHSPRMMLSSDVAMFLLPITAAGFYFKKFCSEKNFKASDLILTWRGGILLIITIGILVFMKEDILDVYCLFLVCALSGIYLTMVVARLILLSNLLTKIFAFIGLKSFHIMALHFIGFKILTSIFVFLTSADFSELAYYTVPPVPRLLYVVFGVCIPLIFCKIYSELIERRFS